MKNKNYFNAIVIIVLLVLIVSCGRFDPSATVYCLYMRNYTSDSLRIVVQGGDIGTFEEYLDPLDYCRIYSKEIGNYPEPALSQDEFDALFDSITVFCKHNNRWQKANIEGIDSFDGWDMFPNNDTVFEYTYRFFIYDSLLNL